MCTVGVWGRSALDELSESIETLFSEEPSRFALEEDVKTLAACSNRLQVLLAKRVRELELFNAGAGSVTGLLRESCRMYWSQAKQTVGAGRVLSELPEVEPETMPYQNLCLISQMVDKIGLDATRNAAVHLNEKGHELHPASFRREVKELIYMVDQDGAFNDEKEARSRRWLELYERYGGDGHGIEGMLDRESVEIVNTALDSLMRPTADDARNRSQMRADALVELARLHLEGGRLPKRGGVKPHVTITTTFEYAMRVAGSRPAVYADGQPLSMEALRRHLCDCSLTRVVFDGKSMPIDLGRSTRVIPPSLRRALTARDLHCRWPGCTMPAHWTDAHHIEHWLNGGETNLDNTCLLCRRHHTRVHEEGWQVLWGEDGELLAVHPWDIWARAPAA